MRFGKSPKNLIPGYDESGLKGANSPSNKQIPLERNQRSHANRQLASSCKFQKNNSNLKINDNQYEKKYEETKQELAKLNEIKNSNEALLKKSIASLDEKLRTNEQKFRQGLKEKTIQIEELKRTITSHEKRNEEFQKNYERMNAKLMEFQQISKQCKSLQSNISRHQKEMNALKDENEELKQILQSQTIANEAKIISSEEEISKLNQSLKAIEKQLKQQAQEFMQQRVLRDQEFLEKIKQHQGKISLLEKKEVSVRQILEKEIETISEELKEKNLEIEELRKYKQETEERQQSIKVASAEMLNEMIQQKIILESNNGELRNLLMEKQRQLQAEKNEREVLMAKMPGSSQRIGNTRRRQRSVMVPQENEEKEQTIFFDDLRQSLQVPFSNSEFEQKKEGIIDESRG